MERPTNPNTSYNAAYFAYEQGVTDTIELNSGDKKETVIADEIEKTEENSQEDTKDDTELEN